ncbi:MAG: DUF58 domain-containing protein [TACK group archaeon]|nr:DUF58 domain-containing protein [TACK group archaeon]
MSVREYQPGDPYKVINWRATARSARGKLMVNEFEREGLRNVIFILDVGPWMKLGISQENALEMAIPLVLSVSKLLLRYGYNVGLWTSPPTGTSVIPSSGSSQFYGMLEAALRVKEAEHGEMDAGDAARLRRVVLETRPYVIALSDLAAPEAARSLGATLVQAGVSRGVVVDLVHTSLVLKRELEAEFGSVSLPSFERRRSYSALPKGLEVVAWDPEKHGMGYILAKLSPAMRWSS